VRDILWKCLRRGKYAYLKVTTCPYWTSTMADISILIAGEMIYLRSVDGKTK
jgi:hypothetical protein